MERFWQSKTHQLITRELLTKGAALLTQQGLKKMSETNTLAYYAKADIVFIKSYCQRPLG
jgi:hypothetical protein